MQGYVIIKIDGKYYRAHRLAWFYVYGEWPEGIIHHKDRVRDHNWIENLEESDNQRNNTSRSMQSNNTTGFTGVYPYRGKKGTTWSYEINKGSKKIAYKGKFISAQAAWDARQAVLSDMGYASDHGVHPSRYPPSHKL